MSLIVNKVFFATCLKCIVIVVIATTIVDTSSYEDSAGVSDKMKYMLMRIVKRTEQKHKIDLPEP